MSDQQRPPRGWFVCGTDGIVVRSASPSSAIASAEAYDKEYPHSAPHLVAAVRFEWVKPEEIDQP